MSKKSNQITLNELRDKSSPKSTDLSFGKKMFGGYNAKQVSDYVETLTENLQNAELSFNNRLEEYASMTTMLKQERDQYGEMYNACKNSKIEMVQQMDTLTKENDELKNIIRELELNENPHENDLINEELAARNLEMQNKLDEYRNYEQECIQLKDQLDELKLMVQDLNNELENYAKNEMMEQKFEMPEEKFEKIISENQVLKEQYEDVLKERSALLVENKNLIEQNKRLSDHLSESEEKNRKLSDLNAIIKLKTQRLIAEVESKVAEYAQNHQRNIDQISENIKMTLEILNDDSQDMVMPVNESFKDIDLFQDGWDTASEIKS